MAMEFTDANFDSEVLKSDKPVLVDFWAAWCGPCQVMGPIISELAEEMGDKVKIGKMDVEANPVISEKYGIMSIPTLKVFKGGQEVKEFIGLQAKEILKGELDKI
jgi:thioredoxin 1